MEFKLYSVQYLSDVKGKVKSVLVPFKLWEDLMSENETKYILKNKKMKEIIDESRQRQSYMTKEEVYEKLGI
jgi:hypothetical protein